MADVIDRDDLNPRQNDDDGIIAEAKRRFRLAYAWEANARENFRRDFRFANGDDVNHYQWPVQTKMTRDQQREPSLTINKVRQHCLQIINDCAQNKQGIVVKPTSNEASYEVAQAWEGIIRHIETKSQAEQAYGMAIRNQVIGGYGVVRVMTDYANDSTFDQDIIIKGVDDPLSVLFDPDAREMTKHDANFVFEFSDMSPEAYLAEFPDETTSRVSDLPFEVDDWITPDNVRVAGYWRVSYTKDTLHSWLGDDGNRITLSTSDASPELIKSLDLKSDPSYRKRKVARRKIEYFKIGGNRILERGEWAGKYLPFVPFIGEEFVIDGQMDRRGHVRMLKDPQRMYNYFSSTAVSIFALQTKTPYLAPAAAIEGYESYWKDANTANYSYLPYNHIDEQGVPIPPPQREPPPTMSDAVMAGMQTAQNEMMMASGQYQSQFGQNENATSGKAIAERQRQGDNATYHYIDNQSASIRQIGRVILDLAPQVLDTKRVWRILGGDDKPQTIITDPQAQQQQQQKIGGEAAMVFDPGAGEYQVEVDIGPSYATKRQEAWNAISQILAQNPQFTQTFGDILFKAADFPGADQIAERLRRMVPPNILGEGPPPQMIQMQQQAQMQMQKMHETIGDLLQKLAEKEMIIKSHDSSKEIESYEAETKRLDVLMDKGTTIDASQLHGIVEQLVHQTLANGIGAVQSANIPQQQEAIPNG